MVCLLILFSPSSEKLKKTQKCINCLFVKICPLFACNYFVITPFLHKADPDPPTPTPAWLSSTHTHPFSYFTHHLFLSYSPYFDFDFCFCHLFCCPFFVPVIYLYVFFFLASLCQVQRMALKKGKKHMSDGSVSTSNIISKMRRNTKEKQASFDTERETTLDYNYNDLKRLQNQRGMYLKRKNTQTNNPTTQLFVELFHFLLFLEYLSNNPKVWDYLELGLMPEILMGTCI